ncbi:hypothetical protein BI041_gp42 [Propionibacterium phage PFR2]|uniref:Uncharacterized protein n=2 Tax=Pulverervirus PFR1 TaxID=2170091 RepID=A0A173G9U4_9CAUD|nr:hypothetical protein BI042_gp40 [Propionibacterium phage PFR1]YP_009290949.1 hypothetical protein BI041_gp42 [Propionibacterium phage PFR2]SCQ46804.1 Hypothetical protein PFR_JS7-1_1854 [Propionibacterium freudenreichii]ANH49906.1 hypothetical protein PFR_40 [Propionibacterium phage PFR1]ANH49965.1 hypothetical protein PFR2_40 [Propionibacterium phage PFR2]SCQ56364.1 Hypothetical protein PFR_JS7-PH_21 [Propionibacterium freudenreichii]
MIDAGEDQSGGTLKHVHVTLREQLTPSPFPPSDKPCPALHTLAGLAPWGDHQPRHRPDATGRCRFCHTRIQGEHE